MEPKIGRLKTREFPKFLKILFFLISTSLIDSIWALPYLVPSPEFKILNQCQQALAPQFRYFQPYSAFLGNDKLYQDVSQFRFEIDDNGGIYRHATLRTSFGENLMINQFVTALDVGPSRVWLQALQRFGQLPMDLNVLARPGKELTWQDIDNFIDDHHLWEFEHPLRNQFLDSQRTQYYEAVLPSFEFAMSQYPRRAWYTPEFKTGADKTFFNTLRNSSYIQIRDRKDKRVLATIRFVRVHVGLLELKHQKTGRILKIKGNAEYTWGANGQFVLGKESLKEIYQLEKFVPDFLKQDSKEILVTSTYDPSEFVELPMEHSLAVELPKNYQYMDLSKQSDFRSGSNIEINGELFDLRFGHTVLVEPGLFAIEKSARRAEVFAEMSLWMGNYLANPMIPEWIDVKSVAYWTYNDLPLYVVFGFNKSEDFKTIHKYGVDWEIYQASPNQVHPAIQSLTSQRSKGSDRGLIILEFLKIMEEGGI